MFGFIAGAVIATFHMPFWWTTPSLGSIALGATLGWGPALGVQLAIFTGIAGATWLIERRFMSQRAQATPSSPPHWSVLRGPWPLLIGAVGLAGLNTTTLALAGHPWSITWAFALWGGKTLQAAGVELAHAPFWSGAFQQRALSTSVLADTTSIMNFGLVLGACLASGLAGRFLPTLRLPLRSALIALGGGILLGYGARIAYGCNIGAYFSGVASTSLHGWLWLIGALLGTPVGVKLRQVLSAER